MKPLKKGQLVVQVISINGKEVATIQRVADITLGIVSIEKSVLQFNALTLREHDPAPLPGCSCRLVTFDDGEEQVWGLT